MLIQNILLSGYTNNFGRPFQPFNPFLGHQGSNVRICIYPRRYYFEILHDDKEMHHGGSFGIQNRFYGSATTKIQRNPTFSTINSDDINHFRGILGEKGVIQDEDWLSAANMDWMRKYIGSSKLLLQPRSTEEVHILSLLQAIYHIVCACYFFLGFQF